MYRQANTASILEEGDGSRECTGAEITSSGVIAQARDFISISETGASPSPIGKFAPANAESGRPLHFYAKPSYKIRLPPTWFRVRLRVRPLVHHPSILAFSSIPIFVSLSFSLSLSSSVYLDLLFLLLSFFRCLPSTSSSGFLRSIFDPSVGRALSHGSISPFPFMDTRWRAAVSRGRSNSGRGPEREGRIDWNDIFGRLTNSFHLARDATPACIYIAGSARYALPDIEASREKLPMDVSSEEEEEEAARATVSLSLLSFPLSQRLPLLHRRDTDATFADSLWSLAY